MPDTHTDDTALRVRATGSLSIEKKLVQRGALTRDEIDGRMAQLAEEAE